MKTATLTLIATGLAKVAVAQFGTLPKCANGCLNSFVGGGTIAGCSQLDIKCICSNGDFLGSIACCLASSCSEDDQKAAVQYAENICKTQGVTDLPPSVACSTGASGSASKASSTPSASSVSSTGGKTTEAVTTSSHGTTADAATVSTSSDGTALSTSPSLTTSASDATSTGSPSSASPTSTNVGSQNMAAMGAGLVGGLAAVAAFL